MSETSNLSCAKGCAVRPGDVVFFEIDGEQVGAAGPVVETNGELWVMWPDMDRGVPVREYEAAYRKHGAVAGELRLLRRADEACGRTLADLHIVVIKDLKKRIAELEPLAAQVADAKGIMVNMTRTFEAATAEIDWLKHELRRLDPRLHKARYGR